MFNVIQNNENFFSVDLSVIEEVKSLAKRSLLRRARLNLHHNSDNLVQEMIIVLCKDTLIKPHRHQNKTESLHVIEGRAGIFFFDDKGDVTRKFCIGDVHSGIPILYRISSPDWHTVVPLDDIVVMHEVAEGPFDHRHNSFPEWTPKTDEDLRTFCMNLINAL